MTLTRHGSLELSSPALVLLPDGGMRLFTEGITLAQAQRECSAECGRHAKGMVLSSVLSSAAEGQIQPGYVPEDAGPRTVLSATAEGKQAKRLPLFRQLLASHGHTGLRPPVLPLRRTASLDPRRPIPTENAGHPISMVKLGEADPKAEPQCRMKSDGMPLTAVLANVDSSPRAVPFWPEACPYVPTCAFDGLQASSGATSAQRPRSEVLMPVRTPCPSSEVLMPGRTYVLSPSPNAKHQRRRGRASNLSLGGEAPISGLHLAGLGLTSPAPCPAAALHPSAASGPFPKPQPSPLARSASSNCSAAMASCLSPGRAGKAHATDEEGALLVATQTACETRAVTRHKSAEPMRSLGGTNGEGGSSSTRDASSGLGEQCCRPPSTGEEALRGRGGSQGHGNPELVGEWPALSIFGLENCISLKKACERDQEDATSSNDGGPQPRGLHRRTKTACEMDRECAAALPAGTSSSGQFHSMKRSQSSQELRILEWCSSLKVPFWQPASKMLESETATVPSSRAVRPTELPPSLHQGSAMASTTHTESILCPTRQWPIEHGSAPTSGVVMGQDVPIGMDGPSFDLEPPIRPVGVRELHRTFSRGRATCSACSQPLPVEGPAHAFRGLKHSVSMGAQTKIEALEPLGLPRGQAGAACSPGTGGPGKTLAVCLSPGGRRTVTWASRRGALGDDRVAGQKAQERVLRKASSAYARGGVQRSRVPEGTGVSVLQLRRGRLTVDVCGPDGHADASKGDNIEPLLEHRPVFPDLQRALSATREKTRAAGARKGKPPLLNRPTQGVPSWQRRGMQAGSFGCRGNTPCEGPAPAPAAGPRGVLRTLRSVSAWVLNTASTSNQDNRGAESGEEVDTPIFSGQSSTGGSLFYVKEAVKKPDLCPKRGKLGPWDIRSTSLGSSETVQSPKEVLPDGPATETQKGSPVGGGLDGNAGVELKRRLGGRGSFERAFLTRRPSLDVRLDSLLPKWGMPTDSKVKRPAVGKPTPRQGFSRIGNSEQNFRVRGPSKGYSQYHGVEASGERIGSGSGNSGPCPTVAARGEHRSRPDGGTSRRRLSLDAGKKSSESVKKAPRRSMDSKGKASSWKDVRARPGQADDLVQMKPGRRLIRHSSLSS